MAEWRFRIFNPVVLSFDPYDLDPIDDDPAEHTGGIRLKQVFDDEIARTFWCAIKSTHITNQHFRQDCLNVAEAVRTFLRAPGDHMDPKSRLFGILASNTRMFALGAHISDGLVDELLPYMTGEKTLEIKITPRNGESR